MKTKYWIIALNLAGTGVITLEKSLSCREPISEPRYTNVYGGMKASNPWGGGCGHREYSSPDIPPPTCIKWNNPQPDKPDPKPADPKPDPKPSQPDPKPGNKPPVPGGDDDAS